MKTAPQLIRAAKQFFFPATAGQGNSTPEHGLLWFRAFGAGSRARYHLDVKHKQLQAYSESHAVFKVIDKIATVSASLPFVFVDAKGDTVPAPKESAVFAQPNPLQSRFELLYQLMSDLQATGTAYLYGVQAVGYGSKFQGFEVLKSESTTEVFDLRGNITAYETTLYGVRTVIPASDGTVLRIANPSIREGQSVMSRLSVLGAAVSASVSIGDTEAFIFKNRGSAKILTNDSDMPMTPTEKDGLDAEFYARTSGEHNAGRAILTNAKLRAIDLYQSPSDLQLDDSDMAKLRVIASTYGLDSKIFGDPKASTYNNVAEATAAAYSQVFIPACQNYIIDALNQWWLKDNWGSPYRLAIDLDAIDEIKTPRKEYAETEQIRVATIASVMAMQATRDSKITVLTTELGYTQEQAEAVLGKPSPADTLRAMHPLLAGKILDRLTPEQIQAML